MISCLDGRMLSAIGRSWLCESSEFPICVERRVQIPSAFAGSPTSFRLVFIIIDFSTLLVPLAWGDLHPPVPVETREQPVHPI